MTTTPELHIRTGRESRPVSGMDTLIARMPEKFYVEAQGEKALLIQPFLRVLRSLADDSAKNLGEELHHADFVITSEPSVVQARGSMHDCDVCRDGVRKALRELRANPNMEMIVGALYWAGPAPPHHGVGRTPPEGVDTEASL